MNTATVAPDNVVALVQRPTTLSTEDPRKLVPTTRTLLERLVGHPYDDDSAAYQAIVDTLYALRATSYTAQGKCMPVSMNDPLRSVYDDAAQLVSDLADASLRDVQQRYLGDDVGHPRWIFDAALDCEQRINEYLDWLAESWLGF